MPDLRTNFITAMGRCANGVSVITTQGAAGQFGITVSAWCSVSADPELILCCIKSNSPTVDAIQNNSVFALNVLAEHQSLVSNTFAGFVKEGQPFDFACAEWTSCYKEIPALCDGVATFCCDLKQCYQQGSHTIFIGQVKIANYTENIPMIYWNKTYCLPA